MQPGYARTAPDQLPINSMRCTPAPECRSNHKDVNVLLEMRMFPMKIQMFNQRCECSANNASLTHRRGLHWSRISRDAAQSAANTAGKRLVPDRISTRS